VHRDIECVTGRDALLKSREAYVALMRAGLPLLPFCSAS